MAVAKYFENFYAHQCDYVETGEVGISRCKICGKESRWLSVAVKGVSR